jgi:flagellar motility protein MotE (MotC chaperone)
MIPQLKKSSRSFLLVLAMGPLVAGAAMAQQDGPGAAVAVAQVRSVAVPSPMQGDPRPVDSTPTNAIISESELLAYCMNVSNETEQLREQMVRSRLNEAKAEVDGKLDELAVRIEELKGWLEKREKFLALANETLVEVYKQMRSDAAASQMMQLNPLLSAAIVAKLPSKTASSIMMEMKPEAAARITELLASAKEFEGSGNVSQLTQ